MKGLLALFPILLLASLAQAEESVWHPIEAGCHEQSPYASLRDWRNAPRSTSTLRFAVEPDGEQRGEGQGDEGAHARRLTGPAPGIHKPGAAGRIILRT